MNEFKGNQGSTFSELVNLDLAQNCAEQTAPSVAATVRLNVEVSTCYGLDALQVYLRREDGIVASRDKVAQVVFVQTQLGAGRVQGARLAHANPIDEALGLALMSCSASFVLSGV